MKPTIVCFSHLRWNFTFQRPNHLMSHFARERRVFYIEEPIFGASTSTIEVEVIGDGLTVCTPHLIDDSRWRAESEQARLIRAFLLEQGVENPLLWFYTPMALPLAEGIRSSAVVYDCMDELSMFLGAPPELMAREQELMTRAELVFTGGHSLYEAKRGRHPGVHAFPSSVDVEHFANVRADKQRSDGEPSSAGNQDRAGDVDEQSSIPRPRVGFFGVIDERMDTELLRRVATERPQYQFVMIGPVVKISEADLPRAQNIHYLGAKAYAELPRYLHGWDVAIMPFALNDATRFISPTKTLEYLAAGKPVVSTAVRDVVMPYGEKGLVRIADRSTFASALDEAISERPTPVRRQAIRDLLNDTSWQKTWQQMSALIDPIERSRAEAVLPKGSRPTSIEQGASECSTI
jgi:glycosyltransferase involved in cell wall biosynthesis